MTDRNGSTKKRKRLEIENDESEEDTDSSPEAMDINEMTFSFESAPVREGWYSTYLRQARGEEILYYPASYSHPFLLPYQMSPQFSNSNLSSVEQGEIPCYDQGISEEF